MLYVAQCLLRYRIFPFFLCKFHPANFCFGASLILTPQHLNWRALKFEDHCLIVKIVSFQVWSTRGLGSVGLRLGIGICLFLRHSGKVWFRWLIACTLWDSVLLESQNDFTLQDSFVKAADKLTSTTGRHWRPSPLGSCMGQSSS